MARPKRTASSSSALRAYLLDRARGFRELYGHVYPGAYAEASKSVDALAAGTAYRFRRWELPDDHPLARDGRADDDLILTVEDTLEIVGPPTP